jgi:DNA-binding PadR family transcriptional regulator
MARGLGEFEQKLMLAVIRLGGNAYGVKIRQEINERTGRDVAIGQIYTVLGRLERKGFVSSRMGEPTPERGGRAKKFYKVEAKGQKALREAQHAIECLSEGLEPATA